MTEQEYRNACAIRSAMQKEATDALMQQRRVIVNWGTGVGKSRVAVNAVKRILERKPDAYILLLVAETAHKDNWRREFVDVLGEDEGDALFASLAVECYASLHKFADTGWDCIIADEAHHLRGDNRVSIIASMSATYVLCLSATLSDRGDGDVLTSTLTATFGEFVTFTCTLNKAIEKKLLPAPKIVVHLLPKEGISSPMTIRVDWGFPKARREMRCMARDFEKIYRSSRRPQSATLYVSGTFAQCYDILTQCVDDAKAAYSAAVDKLKYIVTSDEKRKQYKRIELAKNTWMQYGLRRKILAGQAKTRFAQWLLGRLEGKRYVCFCADVDQAEALGGRTVISARRRDNAQVIEAFNGGKFDTLFAVGMIQEGQNLAGIEAGVILQLSGKERVFVQKFGRAMRAAEPEQHIVVVNDTQDVTYFRNSVEGIDRRYVNIIRYPAPQRRPAVAASPVRGGVTVSS